MKHVQGLVLCTIMLVGVAVLHRAYASQPVLGPRTREIVGHASDVRVPLRVLRDGESVRGVRHSVLEHHGDCYTVRWVCEPAASPEDVRTTPDGRMAVGPACTVSRDRLEDGDVRTWHLTLASGDRVWTEVFFDQPRPASDDLTAARELAFCTYGGMPEGL